MPRNSLAKLQTDLLHRKRWRHVRFLANLSPCGDDDSSAELKKRDELANFEGVKEGNIVVIDKRNVALEDEVSLVDDSMHNYGCVPSEKLNAIGNHSEEEQLQEKIELKEMACAVTDLESGLGASSNIVEQVDNGAIDEELVRSKMGFNTFPLDQDRATGEIAEDPQEVPDPDDDYFQTPNLNDIDVEVGYIPRFENGEPSFIPSHVFVDQSCGSETANPTNPPNPTTPTSNAGPKPPKKKAKPNKEAALHEAMGTYMAKSNEVLEKIAGGVCYEKDLSVKRAGVVMELLKLKLDMDDMFVVNEKICETEQRVETFYALPDGLRLPWVMRVLEGKLYSNPHP
ncbi:hypothetical protein Vadar_021941 [Vaccinium darrowii]|uniref:Uncharacterized protein n=1 Tax=Vaccinium darrowii TaxID=229202 RepID=A0ACB7XJ54_9ERIC|nr:hypothetical protein Vadar_021941 [Vaccinium darrowii]